MLETIGLFVIERVLGVLPGMIVRLVAPPGSIARQVDLDLRRANPINFSLRSEVPNVWLYFRISNQSLVGLTLDRLLIEFWIGQPTF